MELVSALDFWAMRSSRVSLSVISFNSFAGRDLWAKQGSLPRGQFMPTTIVRKDDNFYGLKVAVASHGWGDVSNSMSGEQQEDDDDYRIKRWVGSKGDEPSKSEKEVNGLREQTFDIDSTSEIIDGVNDLDVEKGCGPEFQAQVTEEGAIVSESAVACSELVPRSDVFSEGWRGLGVKTQLPSPQTLPDVMLLKRQQLKSGSASLKRKSRSSTRSVPAMCIYDPVEEKFGTESKIASLLLNNSSLEYLSSSEGNSRNASVVLQRYFGEDITRRKSAETVVSSDSIGVKMDSLIGRSRNPTVSEGGERLKINLDLELYRAKTLRQKGKYIEAEAILLQCVRDWPDDGRAYVALGRLYVKQNKIQEARSAYERGCQALRGENAYVWQAWAVLEEKSGNLAKARRLFDAATVADQKHAAAWHGWANLELRAGNIKRARSLLTKGGKQCGPNTYLLQSLALIESKAGKLEEARSLFAKATQLNPKSAASWLAWALMESESGLQETARRLFQKGIIASPKNRYVWQAWALFEAKHGTAERARELFRRGHELNPKDPVLLQAFALFEYHCGRHNLARDYFRRALVCDPGHQPVWIGWGWTEWKQGNLDVARELYQGAIHVDSRSLDAARAFQAWGVLEEREGDLGLARELFKCALKIDGQNVPAWMSWAAMEDRVGRSVRADEIRNLFLQQRTEVVDDAAWDVDLAGMIGPAIDKIKGFFVEQRDARLSGERSNSEKYDGRLEDESSQSSNFGSSISSSDEEFDVEEFLRQRFPHKYGSGDLKATFVSKAINRSLKRKARDARRNEIFDVFLGNK